MVRKFIKKVLKDRKKKTSPKQVTPKKTPPKRRGRPPKSATQKPKAATGVTKKQSPKAGAKTITSPNTRRRNKVTPKTSPGKKAVPVKKTPTTGQKATAAGITGGVIAAGTLGKKKDMDKMSFNEAFKTARAKLGTDKTFTWRGKKYSTVTMDEVKKAGFNTLAEYNRSKQSKGGKVVGQKGSKNLSKKKPSRSSDFRRKGSM